MSRDNEISGLQRARRQGEIIRSQRELECDCEGKNEPIKFIPVLQLIVLWLIFIGVREIVSRL